MKSFVQCFSALAVCAIIALTGFMVGRHGYPKCPAVVEVRTDTVIVSDTIRDTLRVVSKMEIARVDTVFVKVVGDTILVDAEIPIESKTYQTEDYKAVIEGFRPSLVSMEVYRQTQFIDRVQTVKVPDVRRWSFGPAVGYGVTVQNGRIVGVPTFGVSVQYSFIKW